MKKQSLLLFCLLACMTLVGRAQITTVYTQGFETGENATYTVEQGTATPQTTVAAAGARALKLAHGTGNVTVVLDTISLTNSAWQHFTLEFMHINNVDPQTCNRPSLVGVLEIMRPGVDNDWTKVTNNYYNVTEGSFSTDFYDRASFCSSSYEGWDATTVNNGMWKHERFDFDAFLANQTPVNRKLLVRFTLMARTASGSTTAGWYLDDIQLKVSADAMITPSLTMVDMPDAMVYPHSRGARIAADITTLVPQGMLADSVYVIYRVGSNPTQHKVTMTEMASTPDRYEVYLPFEGYDTMVYWHLVARDATSNSNTATYPAASSAWRSFYYVRGTANRHNLVENLSTLTGSTNYPFPNYADNRSEFVLDSAVLAAAGYKPGAITSLAFTTFQSVTTQQLRERFQIRMANVPTTYAASTNGYFYGDFMKVVYDAPFTINAGTSANAAITVNFQDTFYYAGQDILIRVTYDDASTDPAATNVRVMPTAGTGKHTVYVMGNWANLNSDFFDETSYDPNNMAISTATTLPHVLLTAHANLPLVYDCGISAMAYPNATHASSSNVNDSVVVWLKNYGTSTMHSVPIFYQVDNETPVSYTWNGTLAGGDSVRVRVSTTQNFVVGFHNICAWVGDTMTVSGVLHRDHEPYNDTVCSEFVSCAGAMSGVRQVGGANADYATLDNFIFSLTSCGVDGPLTVKLAGGAYAGMTLPAVPGLSATNTITFEPLSDSVWFEADATMTMLVDLRSVAHVRFHNIGFVRPQTATALQYLVRMSSTSDDCQFVGCWMEDNGTAYLSSLIASAGADALIIDRCRMQGGSIGVDLTGLGPESRSVDCAIQHSTFSGQNINAVKVVYQDNALIDSNFLNNVRSNASYVLFMQGCSGSTRVTANKIFTSHGASAMGLAQLTGTAQVPVVIANNMVACNDDAQAMQMGTPVNLISATHTLFTYNTVRMVAEERRNMAAVTVGSGASALNEVQVINNLIACTDGHNLALSYDSRSAVSTTVDHNVYYTASGVLNKHINTLCVSLADWQAQVPSDLHSRMVEPTFTDTGIVDLRAYDPAIYGCATPIAAVTTDMYGTGRDTESPCAGALEFTPTFYDFNIAAVLSPEQVSCQQSAAIPLQVQLRNTGIRNYDPTTSGVLTLHYRCGTQTGSAVVDCAVPAGETATFLSNATINLAGSAYGDTVHVIELWLTSTIDPNAENDSLTYSVRIRYSPTAPVIASRSVPYASSTTLTPTGVTTWPVHIYNSGRRQSSNVYWYTSATDTVPCFVGPSLVTPVLYADTSYYVAQQRDMGMIKITEVQVSRTGEGVTNPYPAWFGTSTKFAVELTNVGDRAVNLAGDTLQFVSNTGTFTKTFQLPNLTVEPASTLVIQFYTGTTADSSITYYTPFSSTNASPNATTKLAVVYRDGNGMADVVAINGITSETSWNNLHVPATLWTGAGLPLNSTTAGAKRTGWPTNPNATPDNTSNYWTLATADDPMTLGAADMNLMVYDPEICEGERARVDITVTGLPPVDLGIQDPIVAEGCNLGDESLTVTLKNFGTQTSGAFTVHYSDGTTTATDVITTGLAAGASLTHTFTQTLNMHAQSDTLYHLTFWVENYSGDLMLANDTVKVDVTSLFTPLTPDIAATQTCVFSQSTTLTPQNFNAARQTFRWYDSEMNPLATANTYTTDNLFLPDTYYVRGVSLVDNMHQIGTATTTNSAASATQPSPYNTLRKFAREQYVYTAAELTAAGVEAGPINSIAFFIDTLLGSNASVQFTSYSISMGSTTSNAFASGSGNQWFTVSECYTSEDFTVSKTNSHSWLTHTLNTPFVWDGTSNIVVQVCRSLSAAMSAGLKTGYTSSTNRAFYQYSNNADVCGTNGSGSRSAYRPNIRFGQSVEHCDGNSQQVIVTLTDVPANEASLAWTAGVDTIAYTTCTATPVSVRVTNLGSQPISSYQLHYRFDDGAWQTVTPATTIAPGTIATISFNMIPMTAGRHIVTAVVDATGDQMHENDTIRMVVMARFCGGDYTVGGADGLYATIAEAVDTLGYAGVIGAVRFNVAPGTYEGRVRFTNVVGASAENTITFRSSTGVASDVVVMAAPISTANYVVNVTDNASHIWFENLTLKSRGTGNYNHVVAISNASDIHFVGTTMRVKGTADHANGSCLSLGSGVTDLYLTGCVLDSGYYSIKNTGISVSNTQGLYVDSCQLTNFTSRGIDLNGVSLISIERCVIRSGVTIAARPLRGINLTNANGSLVINKNKITLIDTKNGSKTGIWLTSCRGASQSYDKVLLHNNMISIQGSGNNSGTTGVTENSSGITIDGTENNKSRFVEVYYNTVRLKTTDNRNSTTAFKAVNAEAVYVMNNIFSNFSTGYAYFATAGSEVAISDYNDYYSTNPGRLAYWGVETATLAALQAANETDANSFNMEPFFVADDDLHMTTSSLSGRALYNADIPDDIDGTIRTQIPLPTIGAHEYPLPAHDISIASITHPVLTDMLSESDTIMVVASFYNNGASTETNVTWYAQVTGVTGAISATEHITSIPSQGMVTDTTFIIMPLGVIDTQTVVVYVNADGDLNTANNTMSSRFILYPAFNLRARNVTPPTEICDLREAYLSFKLRNEGRKAITPAMQMTIGYEVVLNTPGVTVPTLPIWHEEEFNLTSTLAVGAETTVRFTTPANLYPTGLDTNITVGIRAWVYYEYDLVQTNDTTTMATKQSNYTPQAPVGVDLHIPYATTDVLWASQVNEFSVRWYRDSTLSSFYNPDAYATSTHWNNAPRFFRDTVYYLNCISDQQCTSHFSEIHVFLNPRVDADVSATAILSPATGQVYVERDTVTVRITNYSNQAVSNIPVVYRFSVREGNNYNFISQVREVYTGTLQPDSSVAYAFDTLVQIPTRYFNTARTYRIEAWTDLTTDQVHQNDTVVNPYTFATRSSDTYCQSSVSNKDGMDITRISINNIDWEMPPVGRGYNNMADYDNPTTGRITLPLSMVDTLTVSCVNSDDINDVTTSARLTVYVDYNRDGNFYNTRRIVNRDTIYDTNFVEMVCDTMIRSNQTLQIPMAVPASVHCGFMKARFILNQDTSDRSLPCTTVSHGHVVDWLLFVERDLPTVDLAPARMVTAHDHFVDGTPQEIGFVMVNKGQQRVQSATINYTFTNRLDGTTFTGSTTWSGSLNSGMSAYVTLPSYTFTPGTTDLTLNVVAAGDARTENDTLRYEFHRFHVRQLTVQDNFDDVDYWYAPSGTNEYSHNYWQLGYPNKAHIRGASSNPKAWATDLTTTVTTGDRGTLSILYSPIIDVSQIRSDSLSFSLARNFGQGSHMVIEFRNTRGGWSPLTMPEDIIWYDSVDGFAGSTEDYLYQHYMVPTSQEVENFNPQLQFRLVYYTPVGVTTNASFADGCAFDNFTLRRAQRAIDAGVLAITAPTDLRLGETVTLTVTLINYGFDTLRSVPVAFRTYGSFLPREEIFVGAIAPNGGTASFTFSQASAFTVTSDYPEEFTICAFTRSSSDLYHDNDTACFDYTLLPLERDVTMVGFLTPQERVRAGDSVMVTIRLRNNGYGMISRLPIAVSVNDEVMTDTIDFEAIMGRPLFSMEYFNYSFQHRYCVNLGAMSISSYCDLNDDAYRYNDTISTRVNGIYSLTDLKAKEVVVNDRRVQLTVENLGSRVASGFEVGYYYDNDPTTVAVQTYEGSINAFSTGYIAFSSQLPARTQPYNNITAFVTIADDVDPLNDTTRQIVQPYVDIAVSRILVEENMNDDCRVRLLVSNVGNYIHQGRFAIEAVINGTPISTIASRSIIPGIEYTLDFEATIPKNRDRSYVGTGSFSSTLDTITENNQTSWIIVVNSFEGAPVVTDDGQYVLDQNYPNPFGDATTVSFTIPKPSEVRLFVVDAMGRLCYQRRQHFESGHNTMHINAAELQLSPGVYFYGIECDGHRLMRKMIVR